MFTLSKIYDITFKHLRTGICKECYTFGVHTIPIFKLNVALEEKVSDGYRVYSIFESDAHVFEILIFNSFYFCLRRWVKFIVVTFWSYWNIYSLVIWFLKEWKR